MVFKIIKATQIVTTITSVTDAHNKIPLMSKEEYKTSLTRIELEYEKHGEWLTYGINLKDGENLRSELQRIFKEEIIIKQ